MSPTVGCYQSQICQRSYVALPAPCQAAIAPRRSPLHHDLLRVQHTKPACVFVACRARGRHYQSSKSTLADRRQSTKIAQLQTIQSPFWILFRQTTEPSRGLSSLESPSIHAASEQAVNLALHAHRPSVPSSSSISPPCKRASRCR